MTFTLDLVLSSTSSPSKDWGLYHASDLWVSIAGVAATVFDLEQASTAIVIIVVFATIIFIVAGGAAGIWAAVGSGAVVSVARAKTRGNKTLRENNLRRAATQ